MIIGLTGYAGVGKDSVAKSLQMRYGFHRVAFADKVKEVALGLDPVLLLGARSTSLTVIVSLRGWDEAKRHPEVRAYLQNLGTTLRETIDPLIWVKAVGAQVMQHVLQGDNVVITDVRFPNEIDYLRSVNGKVVRIDRPGVGPKNDHVSETNISDFDVDYFLYNDQGIRQLGDKVSRMMQELIDGR